jgi:hypothetical protein
MRVRGAFAHREISTAYACNIRSRLVFGAISHLVSSPGAR